MEQHPIVTPDSERKTDRVTSLLSARLWIAVQIVAVLYLGQSGALFFYQGF